MKFITCFNDYNLQVVTTGLSSSLYSNSRRYGVIHTVHGQHVLRELMRWSHLDNIIPASHYDRFEGLIIIITTIIVAVHISLNRVLMGLQLRHAWRVTTSATSWQGSVLPCVSPARSTLVRRLSSTGGKSVTESMTVGYVTAPSTRHYEYAMFNWATLAVTSAKLPTASARLAPLF